MQHGPQDCVVVGRQHHALADDGLALLLVVVVLHDVEHTVQEYVGRLHHVDGFQYLLPSVLMPLRVAV